ncbi:MAG: ribulose-phosphate 3-epimerase [Caldisericia bacterium]|nr:ribulose-phosphate 3-epimerase [Caldisericia bacterium]MDD4613871.1 ribulose-phosphate 3-epimerase [Caldisericia bacterium]
MLIGASLLSLPLFSAHEVMHSLYTAGIDYWHIDVMDGNFVPNLALNSMCLQSIRTEYPSIPIDVHFMTTENAQHNLAPSFFAFSPTWFSFHIESVSAVNVWIQDCQQKGIRPGLALSPETPIQKLEPYLSSLSFVLLMSVQPGFGGQHFREDTYATIETLQKIRSQHQYSFQIQVDGGIQIKQAKQLKKMKVDRIVIGSFLVQHPNPSEVVQSISEIQ